MTPLSESYKWRSSTDLGSVGRGEPAVSSVTSMGDDELGSMPLHVVARSAGLLPDRSSPVRPSAENRRIPWTAIRALWLGVVVAVGALVSILLRNRLQHVGISFDAALQRGLGPSWRPYAVVLGPEPNIVSAAAAVALLPALPGLGLRLVLLNAVARLVMWILRLLFRQGRPFWVSPEVKMWHCPSEYGNPSGHALLWLLMLVPLCSSLRSWRNSTRRSLGTEFLYIGGCIFLATWYAILVFSRLYIGTHFPHSIVFGALLGSLLLQQITERRAAAMRRWVFQCARSTPVAGAGGANNAAPFLSVFVICATCAMMMVECVDRLCGAWALPDPQIWQRRAFMECGPSDVLQTRSVVGGYSAVGAVFGTILGMAMPLGERCTSHFPPWCVTQLLYTFRWCGAFGGIIFAAAVQVAIMLCCVIFVPRLLGPLVPFSVFFAWLAGFSVCVALSGGGADSSLDAETIDNEQRVPIFADGPNVAVYQTGSSKP